MGKKVADSLVWLTRLSCTLANIILSKAIKGNPTLDKVLAIKPPISS